MDKQQAIREFDTYYEPADWGAMGHCEQHENTWQAAQAALMPTLNDLCDYYLPQLKHSMASARKFAKENDCKTNHGVANGLEVAIGCIEEYLARINAIIGDKK